MPVVLLSRDLVRWYLGQSLGEPFFNGPSNRLNLSLQMWFPQICRYSDDFT